MYRLIFLVILLILGEQGITQQIEYFELNDFLSSNQYRFLQNTQSDTSRSITVYYNSLAMQSSFGYDMKNLKWTSLADSSTLFFYLNDAWYTKNFQFNVKNFIYLNKDSAADGFNGVKTSIKSKAEIGFYPVPLDINVVGGLRLQASWNPTFTFGGKFHSELEFNYGGLIPFRSVLNSIHPRNWQLDYYLIVQPYRNTFYYGVEEFIPFFYTENSFFGGFDFFFTYVRSNYMGNDKSDRLDLGLRTEYFKVTSTQSIYLLTYYTNNYRLRKRLLNLGISLVVPTVTKVYSHHSAFD